MGYKGARSLINSALPGNGSPGGEYGKVVFLKPVKSPVWTSKEEFLMGNLHTGSFAVTWVAVSASHVLRILAAEWMLLWMLFVRR